MELTRIGKENEESFAPLLNGLLPEDYLIAIGAIEENEAAGVALYNNLGGAMILEYIYVSSRYRKKGIGKALIQSFFAELRELWPITLHVNFPERSEELYKFFSVLGFHYFRDGISWRVKAEAFLESKAFQKMISGKKKHRVARLSDMTDRELSVLGEAMDKEDLDPETLYDNSLSSPLSIATLDEKTGHPIACLLCRQSGDQITLLFLLNFSRDVDNLIDLFRSLAGTVTELSLNNAELLFITMDDKMTELARKLIRSEAELIQEGSVISALYTFE